MRAKKKKEARLMKAQRIEALETLVVFLLHEVMQQYAADPTTQIQRVDQFEQDVQACLQGTPQGKNLSQ